MTRPISHLIVWLVLLVVASTVRAGGGPLRIDYRLSVDDDGLWKRNYQVILEDAVIAAVIGGALWEGGETRLGKTLWQSMDSIAIGAASSETLKRVFTRERPTSTSDPDHWFAGGSNASFPSGEVTLMAAAVTPFVLEYGREYPAVYALELLPIYDGIARMRVGAHWQTDVLAGFALGTTVGYLSHSFERPFILNVLPHGFTVGIKSNF